MTVAMRIQNDTTQLSQAALENYVVIPPGGIIETRGQAIRGVQNFGADSVDVQVEITARYGQTVVLVGTVRGNTRVRGGVPQFARVRFMAVYVWTDDAWKMLASSNTPCHERAVQAGRC